MNRHSRRIVGLRAKNLTNWDRLAKLSAESHTLSPCADYRVASLERAFDYDTARALRCGWRIWWTDVRVCWHLFWRLIGAWWRAE